MHQGIGLDAFNAMPTRKAVHALYECCYSVALAADVARARPYADRGALFRQADTLLFALAEDSIDSILQAYPDVGRRPGSETSQAERRKMVRNELCRINRSRLERMLGPEGGYYNW